MASVLGSIDRTVRALGSLYRTTPLPPGQVVGLVLDAALDRLHPAPVQAPGTVRRTVGLGLALAGVGFTAWAVAERRRQTTGTFSLERPEGLVTTGPYAASRHPMYLGWWLIHSGVGIFRGSPWTLATLPAGILVEHFGTLSEEKMLRREFGQSYADYSDRVPRYFDFHCRHSGPLA